MKCLRILIVDDHVGTAEVLSRLLRHCGHAPATAHSCASALSALHGDRFDLLLSDIGLADGDGCELLQAARAIQPIPAVALTGYGMRIDLERYEQAGFDACLVKPVAFPKLLQVLRDISVPERYAESDRCGVDRSAESTPGRRETASFDSVGRTASRGRRVDGDAVWLRHMGRN